MKTELGKRPHVAKDQRAEIQTADVRQAIAYNLQTLRSRVEHIDGLIETYRKVLRVFTLGDMAIQGILTLGMAGMIDMDTYDYYEVMIHKWMERQRTWIWAEEKGE